MAYDINELLALPNEEKITIADALYNSVKSEKFLEIDEEEIAFLEERLAYYKANPNGGITLEEMKSNLKNKYGF